MAFNRFRLPNTATRGDVIRQQLLDALQGAQPSSQQPAGETRYLRTGPQLGMKDREKLYGRGGGALDVAGIEAGKYRANGEMGTSPFSNPAAPSPLRAPSQVQTPPAPAPVGGVDFDATYNREPAPVLGPNALESTRTPVVAPGAYRNSLRDKQITNMHQTRRNGFADGAMPSIMNDRHMPGKVMGPGTGVSDDVGPAMLADGETVVPADVTRKFDELTGMPDFLAKTTLAEHKDIQNPKDFSKRINQAGGKAVVERYRLDNPSNPIFGGSAMKKSTMKKSPLRMADGDELLPYSGEKKVPFLLQGEGEAKPSIMGALAQRSRESAAKDKALAKPAVNATPELKKPTSSLWDIITKPIEPNGGILNDEERRQLEGAADGRSPLRSKKPRAVGAVKSYADGKTLQEKADAAKINSIDAVANAVAAKNAVQAGRFVGPAAKVGPVAKVLKVGASGVGKYALPGLGAVMSGADAVTNDETGEIQAPTGWRDQMHAVGAAGMGLSIPAALTGVGAPAAPFLAAGGAAISAAPDIYDLIMSMGDEDQPATPAVQTPDANKTVEEHIQSQAPGYNTSGMPEGIASYGKGENGVPMFGNDLTTNPIKPYNAYEESITARSGNMRNDIATANSIAQHAFNKWQDSGLASDEALYRQAQAGLSGANSAYTNQRVVDEAPPVDPIMAAIRESMGYDPLNSASPGAAIAGARGSRGAGANGEGGGRGMNFLDIIKANRDFGDKDKDRQGKLVADATEQLRKMGIPEDEIVSMLSGVKDKDADPMQVVNRAVVAKKLRELYPPRKNQVVDYSSPDVMKAILEADTARKKGTKTRMRGFSDNPDLSFLDQVIHGTSNVSVGGHPVAATTTDLDPDTILQMIRASQ